MRLSRLRRWAINKLASDDIQVFVNVNVQEGKVFFKESDLLICRSTFMRNKFITETPEMDAALQLLIERSTASGEQK